MRKIIADSSCDLESIENIVNGVDLSVVPLKILVEDKEFVDDSNLNMDEMLEELGDPRLIAKTIIDTKGSTYSSTSSDVNYNSRQYNSRSNDRHDRNEYDRFGNIYFKKLSLKDKIKIGLFILGIILLLIFMVIFAFKMFIFLLPGILIIFIIYLISRLFW